MGRLYGGRRRRTQVHTELVGCAEYRYLHFDVDRSVSRFDSQTQVAGTTTSTNVNQFNRNLSTSFDSHIGKIALVYTPWATGLDAYAAAMPVKAVPVVTDSWAGLYFGAAYGAGAIPRGHRSAIPRRRRSGRPFRERR